MAASDRSHGRHTQVYWAGYNLTGQSNALTARSNVDLPDVSCFGDVRKSTVVGMGMDEVAHRGFVTKTANQAHDVMDGRVGSADVLCANWGTAMGDYGVAGSAMVLDRYQAQSDIAGAVPFDATYHNLDDAPGMDWTRIIAGHASRSTADAGSVAHGTSTANGVRAYLQITTVTAGTVTVVLQHSSDGSSWSDLITFAEASDRSAQAGEASGTVEQYLRGNVSGGTATFQLQAARLPD